MPRVKVTDSAGLVQESGSGMKIEGELQLTGGVDLDCEGVTGVAYGTATTMVGSGAQDVAISITQPAGTLLVNAGCVLTVAIAGSSGNINVKLGTSDDGAELIAATALMSSATAAVIGTGVQVNNAAQSEGTTSAAWVANVALYTAAERTLYFRAENSATITAGTIRPFVEFIKV